jgi:hypothetical protein
MVLQYIDQAFCQVFGRAWPGLVPGSRAADQDNQKNETMQSSVMPVVVFSATEEQPFAGVIVVPEQALSEGGYIRAFSSEQSGQSKHLYQAMAQTAYFLDQDDELTVRQYLQPLSVRCGGEEILLERGLAIVRTVDGGQEVLVVGPVNRKKLLEAANRYCTRWVRLDI